MKFGTNLGLIWKNNFIESALPFPQLFFKYVTLQVSKLKKNKEQLYNMSHLMCHFDGANLVSLLEYSGLKGLIYYFSIIASLVITALGKNVIFDVPLEYY